MARREFAVFVDKVESVDPGRITVTASSGGRGGPPKIVFEVPSVEKEIWTINKRVDVTLEWET